jgi:hypothetical protein
VPGSFLAPVTPLVRLTGPPFGQLLCLRRSRIHSLPHVCPPPAGGRPLIQLFCLRAAPAEHEGRTAGRGPATSFVGLPPGPTAGHMAEVAETAALRRDAFFRGLYHPCGTGSSKGNRRRSAAAQSQAAVTALVHPAGQIGGGDPAKAHHPYLSGQPCNSRAMVALSTRPDGLIPSRQSPCPIALKAAKYTLPRKTARCVNVTRGRC